jgi:hypothetical protein
VQVRGDAAQEAQRQSTELRAARQSAILVESGTRPTEASAIPQPELGRIDIQDSQGG